MKKVLMFVLVLAALLAAFYYFGRPRANLRRTVKTETPSRSEPSVSVPRPEVQREEPPKSDDSREAAEPQKETEDFYSWLDQNAGQEQPIYAVFDRSRPDGATLHQDDWIKKCFFPNVSSRVRWRYAFLGPDDIQLENANMFFTPLRDRFCYSETEFKAIDRFLNNGGVVVVHHSSGVNDLAADILRRYGAQCAKGRYPVSSPKDFSGRFNGVNFEGIPGGQSANRVYAEKNSVWHTIVGWSDPEPFDLVSFRSVGKGKLVYIGYHFMMGYQWGGHPYNVRFLGRLFDALARTSVKVDAGRMFSSLPLKGYPSLSVAGYTLYYQESTRGQAEKIKADVERFLPQVRNLVGDAITDSGKMCFVLACCDRLDIGNRSPGIKQDQLICAVPMLSEEYPTLASQREFAQVMVEHYVYVPWNSKTLTMFTGLQYYVFRKAASMCGLGEIVEKPYEKLVARMKNGDPDLTHYDLNGELMPKKSGVPPTFKGDVSELIRVKMTLILEPLYRKDKKIFEKFFRRLKDLHENGRARDAFTPDQFVAVLSSVAHEDLFPVFNEYGFKVDRSRAHFRTTPSKQELNQLKEVSGRKALPAEKFSKLKLSDRVGIEFVGCPAGIGRIGSSDSRNSPFFSHEVAISEPFWIGKYQLTKAQRDAILGTAKGGSDPWKRYLGGDAAAGGISYEDVRRICRTLNDRYGFNIPAGYEFRPPTEAEWEYACRAGTYDGPFGRVEHLAESEVSEACHTQEETAAMLKRNGCKVKDYSALPPFKVGTKRANAWGIYDLLGNGWEWCCDTFPPPPDGMSVADARTQERLSTLFRYKASRDENANPIFSYTGNNAYGVLRGMNYKGLSSCTKTIAPTVGPAEPMYTFRVCIGPSLDWPR